ncbi:MAG: peptidylprolyl isomerase, partial [Parasphingopyxis sp.]
VEADSRESYARSTSPAVAAAAFAAGRGELTRPARSDFGWHVVRVEEIDSRSGRSLAAARGEIMETLRSELADEALNSKYLAIENAIEGGASFAEVAEAHGLSISRTPLVVPNGRSPEDASFSPPPELPPVLEAAFTMDIEEDPLLVPIEAEQRYALVDVTEVARSAPQPLASIRQLVARDYIVDRASRRARQVAAGIAERINNGASVSQAMAAADVDLPPPQQAATTRRAMSQLETVPAPLQLMFRMAENTAKLVRLPADQGWFVVVLENIETDTDQMTTEILAASQRQFGQVLSNEYAEQFLNAVMADYPVERDEEAMQALADRLTGRAR